MSRNDTADAKTTLLDAIREEDVRAPYDRPQITKRRSVARVTLFSGSGAAGASGLTSA